MSIFKELNQWQQKSIIGDDLRGELLRLRLKICDRISDRIDLNLLSTLERMENYRAFFIERKGKPASKFIDFMGEKLNKNHIRELIALDLVRIEAEGEYNPLIFRNATVDFDFDNNYVTPVKITSAGVQVVIRCRDIGRTISTQKH